MNEKMREALELIDGPPECDELVVSADVGELIAPIADTWPLHWGVRSTSKEQGNANAAFIAAAPDIMKLCDKLIAERKDIETALMDTGTPVLMRVQNALAILAKMEIDE